MNLEARLEQVLTRHRELCRQMGQLELEIASLLHEIRATSHPATDITTYQVPSTLVMPYLRAAKIAPRR
jgi:signal transduction histidine kinase